MLKHEKRTSHVWTLHIQPQIISKDLSGVGEHVLKSFSSVQSPEGMSG